ncbi:MAG: xanthine dehydrogenase small subunit [Pseudomonadota bacterium]
MTDTVRFIVNGADHAVRNPDPTLTVLDYLRGCAHLSGTKEGCAEGDCGACTVVLAERAGEGVAYRAVNACILFLPALNGKALITVEGLKGVDGGPHPVQRALIDHHGAQCGFCTPGFVMALYAHYRNGGADDRASIDDALAGNLCRCTGYGPIIKAARHLADYPAPQEPPLRARLDAIAPTSLLALDHDCPIHRQRRRYFAPTSLEALCALAVQHPEAVVLAGGTDVGLWVTKQRRSLATVIAIGGVADLTRITETDEALIIGAGVRYDEAHRRLAALYPDFGEVIRRLGAAQVRNMGTLGGNIANGSPIGDSLPALIALAAKIELRHGTKRRVLALEDYFISYGKQDCAPGEILTHIILPKPRRGEEFHAYKVSKRFDQDISALCGAFAFTIEGGRVARARIAFGGLAATPKRAYACEAALAGAPWTQASIDKASAALDEDYQPISDLRASAGYRLRVARNLLKKAFLESTEPTLATRVLAPRGERHG